MEYSGIFGGHNIDSQQVNAIIGIMSPEYPGIFPELNMKRTGKYLFR